MRASDVYRNPSKAPLLVNPQECRRSTHSFLMFNGSFAILTTRFGRHGCFLFDLLDDSYDLYNQRTPNILKRNIRTPRAFEDDAAGAFFDTMILVVLVVEDSDLCCLSCSAGNRSSDTEPSVYMDSIGEGDL